MVLISIRSLCFDLWFFPLPFIIGKSYHMAMQTNLDRHKVDIFVLCILGNIHLMAFYESWVMVPNHWLSISHSTHMWVYLTRTLVKLFSDRFIRLQTKLGMWFKISQNIHKLAYLIICLPEIALEAHFYILNDIIRTKLVCFFRCSFQCWWCRCIDP